MNQEAEQKTKAEDAFARFWGAWPDNGKSPFDEYVRKKNKSGCEKKWRQKKLDQHSAEILLDVEQRKKYDKAWLNQGGGFLCGPLVYLNQEQWKDGGFADVRDEKRKRASAPSEQRVSDDGPIVSRYGRYANRFMLQSILRLGGVGDATKLAQAVKAKNEIVQLAEQAEANGDKWEDEDFVSVIQKTIREAVGLRSPLDQDALLEEAAEA
jgi:hypothetical protein